MNTQQTQHCYWVADYMISALGCGTDLNAERILAYRTGLTTHVDASVCDKPFVAGRIDWQQIAPRDGYTRLERLMLMAVDNVKRQVAALDFAGDAVGLILSTTKGNIDLLAQSAMSDKRLFLPELAQRIATACGVNTKPIVISNACISGVSALIVAARLIAEGRFRHVLVVGGDLLTQFVVSGFQSFKSVSERVCRPYDAARDGLSMGEACGAVLLSADGQLGGNQPVTIVGGAITNDANHISGPSRTGDGLHYAIRQAMCEAQVEKADLAFVSAHGTATVYNDEMESKALNLSNLLDIPTNSLKPYFGHTLGACGVIESILCVWQLRHRTLFGTQGFETLGVPYPMAVSDEHQPITNGDCCLKIASGFGGCNAAMVLRLGAGPVPAMPSNVEPLRVVRRVVLASDRPFSEFIRDEYRALNASNMKFFKMDNQCKLGYVAAEKLLKGIDLEYDKTRTALVLTNHAASLDTDLKHQQLLNAHEVASPAVFVYTLPNIVSGEICIRHHIQGENTFFVQDSPDGFAREYAALLLHRGIADRVVLGWCEVLGEHYAANFELLTL